MPEREESYLAPGIVASWGHLGSREDQKRVLFLGRFSGRFWGQKWLPKLPKNDPKNKLFFGSVFFKVLELLRCLSGAFEGLRRQSWEASGLQKHAKTVCFLKFLKSHSFSTFGPLHGPSGAVLERLRPIWEPRWTPKGTHKIAKKVFKNGSRKRSKNLLKNGDQNLLNPARPGGPFWGLFQTFGQEGSR